MRTTRGPTKGCSRAVPKAFLSTRAPPPALGPLASPSIISSQRRPMCFYHPSAVARRTVRVHESRHQYWFHVMLLSSHINGALLRIHVAPTRPDLAANPNLCFTSRHSLLKAASPGGACPSCKRRSPTSHSIIGRILRKLGCLTHRRARVA